MDKSKRILAVLRADLGLPTLNKDKRQEWAAKSTTSAKRLLQQSDEFELIRERLAILRNLSHRVHNKAMTSIYFTKKTNYLKSKKGESGVNAQSQAYRDVLNDNDDPLASHLKDQGVPTGFITTTINFVSQCYNKTKEKQVNMGDQSLPSWKYPSPVSFARALWRVEKMDYVTMDGTVKKVDAIRVPLWSRDAAKDAGRKGTSKCSACIPIFPPTKNKNGKKIAHNDYWWARFKKLLDNASAQGGLKIIWDKKKKKWCALISVYEDKAEPSTKNKILGVDIGITNPVVCAVGHGWGVKFIGSKREMLRKKGYFKNKIRECGRSSKGRKWVPGNGGRGFKRRNKKMMQIQNAAARYCNTKCQQYAAKVVKMCKNLGCGIIAIEKFRKSPVKQAQEKSANDRGYVEKKVLMWRPYLMHMAIINAATRAGIQVIQVDAGYTSQRCAQCGCILKANRDVNNAQEFCCQKCGHKENADVNAARNVAQQAAGEWKAPKKIKTKSNAKNKIKANKKIG